MDALTSGLGAAIVESAPAERPGTNGKVVVTMGSKPVTVLAPAGGAALLGWLPLWCAITFVAAGVVLTALQVVVTQIIRLRATNKIVTSAHALRVLEIQDRARAVTEPRRIISRR